MTSLLQTTLKAIALAIALVACSNPPSEAPFVQSSDGLTGYLGVAPSAAIEAHAPEHVERRMHAGEPSGNAHLVVAIFDDASGARVTDAAVDAVVRGERHSGARRLRLEPMSIADTITYGGFISLAANDRYHIDVVVRRQRADRDAHLRFVFDGSGLPSAETTLPAP